jgi:hypothetical protein
MEFRTELHIKPSNHKLDLGNSLLSIGSCFANTMGERMEKYKFDIMVNPFGVVFNPISIFQLLQPESIKANKLVGNNGMWYSYDHHSDVSASSNVKLEELIIELNQYVLSKVHVCEYVIITLGSAWVYILNETNQVVANCHKMPGSLFEKSLLNVREIIAGFDVLYKFLKEVNPKIKFIFTVSPVRHIRDTIELNSVSKSVLRLACHELTNSYTDVSYFPSYEIMMDDLRDYRFYKSDMIHPNKVAEDYIWDKWSETLFEDKTKAFIKEWDEILNAINHKPFDQDGAQYQAFVNKYLIKLEQFKSMVSVDEEVRYFISKLK